MASAEHSPTDRENHLLDAFQSIRQAQHEVHSPDDKEHPAQPPFPIDSFFTEWFRVKGQPYYFLFKKNLKITNIQVAELLALLRAYRLDSADDIHFLTVSDFKEAISRIAGTFGAPKDGTPDDGFIATNYAKEILNTVAIDVLYGSCLVYLPASVNIDLAAVCSRSGYIHSYGPCVYVRNIYKGNKEEMFRYLRGYLARTDKCVLFRPYSHEDFTFFDRNVKDDLRSGLDDVLVFCPWPV